MRDKFLPSGGRLILLLLMAIGVGYSCGGGPPKKLNDDAESSATVRLGSIRGTVLGCDDELVRDARVDVNTMPDSMVTVFLTSRGRAVYNAKYFDSADYHDTVRTNSEGEFLFDNLPLGYYQLWFYYPASLSRRDSCDRSRLSWRLYDQVDFVRVAPDSIAIAVMSVHDDPTVRFAAEWFPIYEPLVKGSEDEVTAE